MVATVHERFAASPAVPAFGDNPARRRPTPAFGPLVAKTLQLPKQPKMPKQVKTASKRLSALTTGQAAEYCLVSPDTIQNWIQSRGLPAQRTAGGQYRVRPEDLRSFMLRHGMSVAELDADLFAERIPRCWEYFAALGSCGTDADACEACIVYRSDALRCFELRHHAEHLTRCGADGCQACPYYQEYKDALDAA